MKNKLFLILAIVLCIYGYNTFFPVLNATPPQRDVGTRLLDENRRHAGIATNPFIVAQTNRTGFGETLVAQVHPIFQGTFEYTVDNTRLNTNTVVNGGTVTQASGMAVMTTSTTTGSSALFQTKQHARYNAGVEGVDRTTFLFTTGVAGTQQFIGLADETGSSVAFKNGYMLGYDGVTFGFHRFSNDTLTTIAIADWDDPLDGSGTSGMTIDQTKLNVGFIQFQFLGGGAITIFIEDDDTGFPVKVHTVDYANANTEPSVHNPNFFHTMWVSNSSTSSNVVMKSASYMYGVEGKTKLTHLHQPTTGTGLIEKSSVGTETAIFTIRNRTTYASKTNFIDVLLKYAAASIEANSANNLGSVRFILNTTLGGTPSFSNIGTDTTVIEIDTAGTTVTGGIDLGAIPLAGKNDDGSLPFNTFELVLNPGDTITAAGKSANDATIDAEILYRDLF